MAVDAPGCAHFPNQLATQVDIRRGVDHGTGLGSGIQHLPGLAVDGGSAWAGAAGGGKHTSAQAVIGVSGVGRA